ncbi:hypothetical protein QBC35DRAFT_502279 [Podospora australis]|uniref:Uncharacterized protein n=1 Tax=Podospora australis TaxID=1536484 RepID=A0AAN7AHD6_9PEZI|nr:hypothetical protein QBC35DRAFT_502279 [Podospora australis]
MSQLNKAISKGRDPPPSLFLHPATSASHVSLPGPGPIPGGPGSSTAPHPTTTNAGISSRPGSSLLRSPPDGAIFASHGVSSLNAGTGSTPGVGVTSPLRGGLNISNLPLQVPRQESTRATDRTDALWAEMQATLEEVELSASGGTRVFGPDHERKLDELRLAQIALAQAWARSEADEAIETVKPGGTTGGGEGTAAAPSAAGGGAGTQGEGAATEGGKSTVGSGSAARSGSSGMGGQRGFKMEEETEVDILLARKRREANDRYFQRVNQGVLDVVAKLEEVAVAMRAVELESKEIWNDGDGEVGSVSGSAKT